MPYTPPSQQSPAASSPQSPALTRSNSYFKHQDHNASKSRPGLPRSSSSTSYLNRERRSPSFQQSPTPDATPVEEGLEGQKELSPPARLAQSPSLADDGSLPDATMISPPDSAQSSSDDDEPERGRARELQMRELKDAISAIEMHRQGSPEADTPTETKPKLVLDLPAASLHNRKPGLSSPTLARKISHSRSNTDSAVMDLARQAEESLSSDSDVEDERLRKPPMLRKKSGELVRPALRPPSARRRPSSMPGTPTYSKAVHFDDPNLEHVRHFLKVDRPLAVSAGSSPVEQHEGEHEFPFPHTENRTIEPPWQWEIRTPNFPAEHIYRKHMPIRVERVFVSADNKNLIGSVAVHNIAFHKSVIARFTLDYWKTTSEVSAEYSHDIRRKQIEDGHDRFNFSIKLEDLRNLEKKSLFFCVRYSVNGQEFWDSNGGINYQIDFSKKALPQKGKSGSPGNASLPLNASPRIRPSQPSPTGSKPRPLSVPNFDDFAHGFDTPFGLRSPPTAAALIGEKPIKFRNQGPDTIVPDAPGIRPKTQGKAFSTRYNFGASLSATKQGASFVESPGAVESPSLFSPLTAKPQPKADAKDTQQSKVDSPLQKSRSGPEKVSTQSQSYNDLINKYCFFGSTKSSTSNSPRPESSQLDGTSEKTKPASDAKINAGPQEIPLMSSPPDHDDLVEEQKSPSTSPRISRAASPSLGSVLSSRTGSPASFGYPYRRPMHNGLFGETQAPTAIHG